MKVFISWSGDRSRAVAELLDSWLRCVIQALRPWISTRDIDRGALWLGEINDHLKDTTTGIVCLTQENKNRPWILFETGALARGLSSNRVCTFLIDLKPSDLVDPLAQFNHTLPNREGLHSLVRTLNSSLGAQSLDPRILDDVFATYWPKFETDFATVLKKHTAETNQVPRPSEDILSEILENTRQLGARVRTMERTLPSTQDSMEREASPARVQRLIKLMMSEGMDSNAVMKELGRLGVPFQPGLKAYTDCLAEAVSKNSPS